MGPRSRFDFFTALLRRMPGTRRTQIVAAGAVAVALVIAAVTMTGAASLGLRTAAAPTPNATTPTPFPKVATACPADKCPQPGPPTGDADLDHIWYGAIPPDQRGPVLVFVHGISGIALDWWSATPYSGTNDMYVDAYASGYRTAFVTLNTNGQRAPGNSMWINGQTLAKQLAYIANYYGVPKVDLVTHSKGGVDAQTAIVYYGASQYVNEVFTLSAPNLGSPLAELVCTSPTNPISATCTMTPAYMAVYRQLTDPKAIKQGITYHQAGGTDPGPLGSMLWAAGVFLKLGGYTNDGFVPISSSLGLTYEPQFFIRQYDHDSIRLGHNSFPWIRSWLQGGTTLTPVAAQPAAQPATASQPAPGQAALLPVNQSGTVIRTGALNGPTTVTIPVDAGTAGVNFAVLTSDQAVTAALADANGQDQPLSSQVVSGDEAFAGNWYQSFEATSPAAGQWKLNLSGPAGATYQVIASFASPLDVRLDGVPFPSAVPGQTFTPQVTAVDAGGSVLTTNVTYRITSIAHGVPTPLSPVDQSGAVQLPSQPDLVTIRFTVTGQTSSGSPFERSFARTLPVLSDPKQLVGLGSAPGS
jgi:PGAP1-like protein